MKNARNEKTKDWMIEWKNETEEVWRERPQEVVYVYNYVYVCMYVIMYA